METVNRILQEKITARIAPNKAVLIFGARRVGKTVMMRKIVDNYSGRTMMLNGEDYDTLALLENRSIANYRHLLDGIDLLAIDEAQNIPQIGSILKLIVDEIPGISVLASGSSSFDLLNKTGEPLVGRSTQFLLTLNLGTFLREEEEGLFGLLLRFLFLLLRSFLLIRSLIELGGYQQHAVVLDTFLVAPLFGLEVTLHGEH